ncbi:MAG: bifunctional metallophosphatase/5'-nucleotidase [Acholeplasmataceae bacterium]|nr:bifunctional metallophosphatase/5'-nucleotidase [Acholeplasmataceae bacterium]
MKKQIHIIYTSDSHGKLSAYDFLNKNYGSFGLSRLPNYLKTLETSFLLLDNGDFLQGSPLLDYSRKQKLPNPVAKVFNALNYEFVTLGNHDFNYGLSYLSSFQSEYHGEILCANIYKDNQPFFKTHVIKEIDGIKIAIIGVTTEFIPFWEKPENLKDLIFLDAVETTKKIIDENNLTLNSDLIVVLYHGGFNKNLDTHQSYASPTVENKGYELFQIKEIDILCTGHQHIPMVYKKDNRIALQTSHNAKDFGEVTIDFDDKKNKILDASICQMANYTVDQSIESLIHDDILLTNTYLSQKIGTIKNDMRIHSPLDCRIKKHPLFQLINQIQLDYTGANLSIASLPNETHGFPHDISLNDIAVNFPYENDLVVLEITGKLLKDALEKNATYFSLENNKIVIHPQFLYPKVEHYNYDVYDGIDYIIDVSKPIGERITTLKFKGKNIKPTSIFKLALNSYRAVGSGGFDMFNQAIKIIAYPVSYFDLIRAYIEEHPVLKIDLIENYKVIK